MNERRSINPSRIVLADAEPYFYPIANTPTVDLCEDVPPRDSVDNPPLSVCLLGAGDVRNVLFITHQRRKRRDQSKLKFYVNDQNPAIVARDILLLTVAAQALQKGRRLVQFVDFFVQVYADLFLTDHNRTRVDAILEDLLDNFPSKGSSLMVSEADQLWHVKKTWALWLTNQQRTCDVSKARQEKNKVKFEFATQFEVDSNQADRPIRKSSRVPDPDSDQLLELRFTMATVSNSDLAATLVMRDEVLKYYKSGNIGGQLQNRLNPTLIDPETREFPHYLSNPFQSIMSATEEKDYKDSEQTLLATLKSCLKRFLSVFARELKSGNIEILFDVGDCNSFLSERLSPEAKFDVIDTSNLADNLGLINLLVLGIPRLNRNDPHSTLWTQTLKAQIPYTSLNVFLRDSLGFQYDVSSTMLQTVCTVPFESACTFDEEGGKTFRPNTSVGLFLKWKPSFSVSTSPNMLDLAPRPDACFFRQFIDATLSSIYDSYTGRLQKLTDFTMRAALPREFTMTVSTLIHVLCQATKTLKHPRQVFDYLYEKVQFRTVAQPLKPGETLWGVFALDVQITASLICPDEYKPLEPLHPLLASRPLETRLCRLSHTAGRTNHPTPVIGWLLMENYKPLDGKLFQTMPSGLPAKVIDASATEGSLPKYLLRLADNVFHYIERNVYRLQFIDSMSICLPDTEALVTLPSSLFTSDHNYAIVGVSTLDGTFLYSPLTYRSLKAATAVCVHTQTLQCSNPTAAELETESGHDVEVSVLREYHDRFDATITSKTPLKSSWKMTSKKAGPLEVRLSIGDAPKSKDAVTESTCLLLNLSSHVDVNPAPRLLEFLDERNVKVSLSKSLNALHPTVEKLDLDSLDRWPVNRPLGVGLSMFTVNEIEASNTSRSRASGAQSFGHDPYFDARKTVYLMFDTFVDQQAQTSSGTIKLRQDGKKLFYAVSSLEEGFIAYTPHLLITSMGTPVVEIHYLYSTVPTQPEVHRLLAFIQSRQRIDHELRTTQGTDEEIDLLRRLLERNTDLLKDATPRYLGGVTLNRSFFIPIYPKDGRLGARRREEP